MVGVVMVIQFTAAREMFVTALTVGVSLALDPVFFQPNPSTEVNVAFVTNVVGGGVGFVLVECGKGVKVAVASFALVGHPNDSVEELEVWKEVPYELRIRKNRR
jgi:hypothetical protein